MHGPQVVSSCHIYQYIASIYKLQSGAEEVVDMRGGWADPDLVSGLVW